MGKLRALFESGLELTPNDVEARLFIDVRNGREYLKILKDEEFIYIVGWCRLTPHGRWTPTYALKRDEDDRDAVLPPKVTPGEARRKIRADPERWQAELKAARIRRKAKNFANEGLSISKIDPLMAIMYRDAIIPNHE